MEGQGVFFRYLGIDYSGASTPTASLPGLRVYGAEGKTLPSEISPPKSSRKHWTRKGVAEYLVGQLAKKEPVLVGIDHCFSFPCDYFTKYCLPHDWPAFLDVFQEHWPTHRDGITVESLRKNAHHTGDTRWRRITDRRAGGAKSPFLFDVPGSVAKSTHAGIPWLWFIREQIGDRVHFWPFDGWEIPCGCSVVAEVYPRLWNRWFSSDGRTGDQHDAFSVAAWLSDTDRSGRLATFLKPDLEPSEKAMAQVEGWILGVT